MHKIALLLVLAVLAMASAAFIPNTGLYGSPLYHSGGYAPLGGLYRTGPVYGSGLYRHASHPALPAYYY